MVDVLDALCLGHPLGPEGYIILSPSHFCLRALFSLQYMLLQLSPHTFNGIDIRTACGGMPPVDGKPAGMFGIVILHEAVTVREFG